MKAKRDSGLVIGSAKKANIALLGKLVWSILHQTNKPWVHLLRSKYISSGNIFNHLHHVGASCT